MRQKRSLLFVPFWGGDNNEDENAGKLSFFIFGGGDSDEDENEAEVQSEMCSVWGVTTTTRTKTRQKCKLIFFFRFLGRRQRRGRK